MWLGLKDETRREWLHHRKGGNLNFWGFVCVYLCGVFACFHVYLISFELPQNA